MKATKIFNTQDLPGRIFHSKALFALKHSGYGSQIMYSRQDLARKCAEMIVSERDFFDYKEDGRYATIRVDLVVFTEQELTDLMRSQFEAGVRHALHNMPSDWMGGKP